MAIKISGILRDGMGRPVPKCTIELLCKKTSLTVVVETEARMGLDVTGSYDLLVEPGQYDVSFYIIGFPPKRVGDIQVYSDSRPGTLNDFLMMPGESDLTPELVLIFQQLRDEARQAANEAKADKELADSILTDVITAQTDVNEKQQQVNADMIEAGKSKTASAASAKSAAEDAVRTAADVATVAGLTANAETAAQQAEISNVSANGHAGRAEAAADSVKTLTASANTLAPGTNATALWNPDTNNLLVGVPSGLKGDKGDKGEQGIQGIQGIQGVQGIKGDKGDTGPQAQLSPLLTSMSGLTTAANQLIYSNGVNTVTTTSFTAVGRSIVAAVNAAGARTTIGAAADGEVLKIGNNLADINNAAETIRNLGIGEWGGVPLSYGETRPWGDVDNSNLNMPAGIYQGVASNWGSPPGSGPTQDLKIINTSSGNWVPQLALVDAPSGGAMWIRSIYNGAYTKWDKLLTASLTGFGTENPTDGPIASNSATLRPGMYYGIGNNVGNPGGITTGGVGVLQFTGNSPTYRCQLAVQDGGGGRLFIRATTSSVWGAWRECYSTGNTTIDANGFIKKASPIVKLHGNGECELNYESAGVTTERLSEGIYRLSGSLMGFHSDAAWDIEVPADDNKQPLIWVKSTVEANGDIIVKTYHRTHPNAPKFAQNIIEGYSDGDPIDIPAGRWVDLRVQVYTNDTLALDS